MADNDALLQAQLDATIEPNVREEPLEYGGVGVGLMYWMAQAGQIMPPWWSKERDKALRKFWKDADHLASAFWMIATKMSSVPFVVTPRDHTIKGHVKQAAYYNTLLQEQIQFGGGWAEFWMPFFIDLWTMDNGSFGEVIGGGKPDGPIEGPVIGLRHLDSWRCSRTSSPEFPVIYQTIKGAKHKLHHSRVIFVSQLPSPSAEMYGVGHSWSTRAINTAQHLVDISVYKQEKLGSRPPRQLLIGKGMSLKELADALRLSNEDMDNQGLKRYSKTALIAGKGPDLGVDRIDLATVPDGFEERTSTELGMYLIALAGGFPPRWLWPATTTGATKADAMYQHIAGTGGGASWHIQMMTRLLGGSPRGVAHSRGKVLPPHLKLVFDYQDDEQDRAQSEIRKTRADTREKNLNTGSTTVRVNREQMLQDGELTEAQFRELELNEGRLPDGESAITLFVSEDPVYQELLDLNVEEPILTISNDPEEMLVVIEIAAIEAMYIVTNTTNKVLAEKANNALAALSMLKEAYEPLVAEAVQQDMEAEAAAQEAEGAQEGGQQTPMREEDEPGTEQDNPKEPDEEDIEPEEEEIEEGEVKDILTAVYLMKDLEPSLSLQNHYEVLDKSFNFGAKMGQVIRGALARGAGGRFVNARELAGLRSQLMSRMAARLRGARARMGKRKPLSETPQKKFSAERRARLDALIGALRESKGPKAPKGGAKKKPKKPKKPAAPKKPTGGAAAKPKIDPEVAAKKKRAEQAKTRDSILDTVANSLNVDREALTALHAFLSAGKEGDASGNIIPFTAPGPEQAAALAAEGLLEFDAQGNPIATTAARSLLAAAKADDQQRAQEAISKARSARQAKVDKLRDLQNKTTEQREKREELQTDYREDIDKIDGDLEEDRAKWDGDKASLDERLAGLQKDPSANASQIAEIKAKIKEGEDEMQERQEEAEEKKADAEDKLQDRLDKSEEDESKTEEDIEELSQRLGLSNTKEALLKSEASFRGQIRAAIRGGWNGTLDMFGVTDSIVGAISRDLVDAWNQGALSCGIKEDELTGEELNAREVFVNGQMVYVFDFASTVVETGNDHRENPRDRSFNLGPLLSRGEVWANRWPQAFTMGKTMACANQKLKWVLGEAEHCSSCLKLNGKVKRASFWQERGILPRVAGAPYLECKGWRCQCNLVETEDSLSKGPLPGLP